MALQTLGYSRVIGVPSHMNAVERIKERNFSLVLFDAKPTDISAQDFVSQVVAVDQKVVLVALSANPRIDDVFSLLKLGARGFLAVPFTTDSVRQVIDNAFEGPQLSETILQALDRNAALAGLILNNLYRTSVLMRQAREIPGAARELRRAKTVFNESAELARLFCKGSDESLRAHIVELCLNRAGQASSRLGRTRRRLKTQREAQLVAQGHDLS